MNTSPDASDSLTCKDFEADCSDSQVINFGSVDPSSGYRVIAARLLRRGEGTVKTHEILRGFLGRNQIQQIKTTLGVKAKRRPRSGGEAA